MNGSHVQPVDSLHNFLSCISSSLKSQKYLIVLSDFIFYSVVFIAHYPEYIQLNFLYIGKYLIVPKVKKWFVP